MIEEVDVKMTCFGSAKVKKRNSLMRFSQIRMELPVCCLSKITFLCGQISLVFDQTGIFLINTR